MPGKRWTPAEIRALKRAWEQHRDVSEVSVRGRSADSIKRKLVREGLLDVGEGARSAWTSEEEVDLKGWVAGGLTARQVHERHLPGRSQHSIAQKISRMKLLAGEGRSQQLRDCRRLEGEELQEFEEAIRDFGATRHTAWFVWKFAIGRGKVKRALRAQGCEVTWRDAMRLPQTQQRFTSRVSQASAEAWERRRVVMKGAMVERLHSMQCELSNDPELARRQRYHIRQCEGCKAEWFADAAFFKTSFKSLPEGGRRRYLQRNCRICTSGQRGSSAKARILEGQRRDGWRDRIESFEEMLGSTHPELYREPGDRAAIRWEPFIELLESKTTSDVMALVESVVRIYAESAVSEVLDRLEEIGFGGDPVLHEDVWSLDERLRVPSKERPSLVRDGCLLKNGKRLAIRLYRVVRLPEYSRSLV